MFIVLRDFTPTAWKDLRDRTNGLPELVQFDAQDDGDTATFVTEADAYEAIGRTAVALANHRHRFPDFRVLPLSAPSVLIVGAL